MFKRQERGYSLPKCKYHERQRKDEEMFQIRRGLRDITSGCNT
jgi:hypothetical protein